LAVEGIDRHSPAAPLYDARRGIHYDKPHLRGWLHLVSFEVALIVGTLLVVASHSAERRTVAAIYGVSVAAMFGVSALYHRGRWSPAAADRLQRLDHLAIFFVIAGSATPPIAECVPAPWSGVALSALWGLTAVAAGTRLLHMQVPEWLAGTIFIALGWLGGAAVPAVWIRAGVAPALLLVAGGLLYTAGALAYHWRRPDPRPAVFGYHEVFHSFVTAAAACQYVAIACFVL
jgi:hemolysin III